jgi:hypothetical protein
MTSTSVDTSIASLSVTLAEPVIPPTPRDFSETIEDLESLLFVGSVLGTLDAHLVRSVDRDVRFGAINPVMISPDILTASQRVAESFRIVRVSYPSPIEILMQTGGVLGSIAAIGTAAFLTVKGVLSLWRDVCDTRKKHSETALAVSDATLALEINERLRKTLPVVPGSNLDRATLDETERRALIGKPFTERLAGAAKILMTAEEIAVVES